MEIPRAERGPASTRVAVLGPGRIGRQIALAFALGGCPVVVLDLKPRPAGEARAVFEDCCREIERDLRLMTEEEVVSAGDAAAALDRIRTSIAVEEVADCGFVQEALPEVIELKREVFRSLSGRLAPEAVIASTSSTISPSHLVEAVTGPDRFLVVHWLNPAHIIPLWRGPSPSWRDLGKCRFAAATRRDSSARGCRCS